MSQGIENWRFHFSLSPKINCESTLPQSNQIEFDVDSQNTQYSISGFSVLINNKTEEDAANEANLKAQRITDLLVSTSGTSSSLVFDETRKINPNGSSTVSKKISFRYSIVDNANLTMSDTRFNEIVDGQDLELIQKMNFVRHAADALSSRDSISTIRFLDLACNEEPLGNFSKFHFLRHALSHYKSPLKQDTLDGINNGFGNGYFDFTIDDKFDFSSSKNIKNLSTEAQNFLNGVRQELSNEL